jgi:endonuclease-3
MPDGRRSTAGTGRLQLSAIIAHCCPAANQGSDILAATFDSLMCLGYDAGLSAVMKEYVRLSSATHPQVLADEVFRRLLAAYGEPDWRPRLLPVEELVLTFLSQNTSDVNSGRAFETLRARYPTWQAVVDAPTAELAETIRSGGLAQRKAPRIQNALRRILAEQGKFSIDFLADLPTDEAMRWLTSLDGVGHKTASIVLLFCFAKPAFPVDTHVGRVTRRLGLARPKDSEEKIKAIWEELVPPEWYYPLHLNLIRHGRQVCRARAPDCPACVLNDVCQYNSKRSRPGA